MVLALLRRSITGLDAEGRRRGWLGADTKGDLQARDNYTRQ